MSLIAAVIVVLGTANNSLFAQLPTITEKISAPLVYTSHIFERTLSDAGSTISQYSAAALTGAKSISENGRAILSLAGGSQSSQEIFVDFEDESLPVVSTQDSQVAELRSTPQTPNQPTFPPQVTTLEGSRIYVPETTYTAINSDAIEKKLLIQKDYFSKQIDRIYDRLQTTSRDLNDRIDVVGTGGSSGISFATIALGGTGISTVPSYGQLLMGDGSGGYTLIATSSLGISGGGSSQWTTSGSDIYYTTGSVGIGTTTLNGRLTIEQTHDAQTVARISNFSDSPNAYTELSVRAGNVTTYLGSTPQNSSTVTGAGSSGRGYVWSQATGANRGLDLIAASTNSDLRFYTAGYAAANERMRITSTGNVGVGTINPVPEFGNSWGSGLGMGVVSSSSTATIGVRSKSSTGYAFFDQTNDVGRSLLFGTYGSSYSDGGANTWFGVSKPGNSFMFTYADSALGIGTFGNRDLTLGTNNLPRITVLGSGNVGIGSTSPSSKLSVLGDSYFGGNVNIRATGSGPQLTVNALGNGNDTELILGDGLGQYWGITRENSVGNSARGDLSFYSTDTRAGDLLTLGTRGLVGIGSTSPYAKLSIAGTSAASTTLAIRPISGQTANILDIYNTSGVLNTVITSSGNVGIGTTTPGTKLEVNGGITAAYQQIIGLRNSGGAISEVATINNGSLSLNSGRVNTLRLASSGINGWDVGTSNAGIAGSLAAGGVTSALAFYTGGNEAVRILSTGNVGIGTTSPTYKLEVAGDVGATSFINMSSRSVKKDINYVPFEQTQQALDKIKALKFATYRYITENDSEPLHLGLIAEESPEDILAPGGRGIDVYKMATFALQGIQSLIARIEKIEATLANVTTGYTDIFKAKTVEVEQGITIKDSKTGEYYCIVVENGTMKNIPGKCGVAPVNSSNSENSSDSDDSANNDSSDNDDSEVDAGGDEESGDTSTSDNAVTETTDTTDTEVTQDETNQSEDSSNSNETSEPESDSDETNEQSEEGTPESAEESTNEGTEDGSSEITPTTTVTDESSQNDEGAEDAESNESSESSSDQSSDSAPAASSSDIGDSSEGSSDSSSSSSSESSSSSSESSTGSTDSGSSGTQE